MQEIWKDIHTMEGRYQISNFGNARSFCHRGTLDPNKLRTVSAVINNHRVQGDYRSLFLTLPSGKRKNISVQRAVAIAYIPNPENKPCVNHIDGNKRNNHVDNLEWATYKENTAHAYLTGLAHGNIGLNHPHIRPVNQYTIDGEFIVCYDYIKAAEIATGARADCISKVCKGKSLHTGRFGTKYKWAYADK